MVIELFNIIFKINASIKGDVLSKMKCLIPGVGCFAFAPFANYLLEEYGWKVPTYVMASLKPCLKQSSFLLPFVQ